MSRIQFSRAVLILLAAPDFFLGCSSPESSSPTSAGVASDSATGVVINVHHECSKHYQEDARDGTFADQAQIVNLAGGNRDTGLPDPLLDWLDEQNWTWEHDDWHNVRRWDMFCRKSNSGPDECETVKKLTARGLARAPIVETAPGDGYAFMVMHRHMIRGIREAFPSAARVLAGFEHVPTTQDHPENPQSWRGVRWSDNQLNAIDKLEHIEDHLDEFPTEDDLGTYIQDPFRWTADNPTKQVDDPTAGIHTGLHSQWTIGGSPVDVGGTRIQIYNSIFWRLHGWIDNVWQRYRVAKGIGEDDPTYVQELLNQCQEMHDLGLALHEPVASPLPPETGVFATEIRPILDERCVSCHGGSAPTAGLILGGGGVTSSSVREGLVGKMASQTALALVAPGDPDGSWLLLKTAGSFDGIDCKSCKTSMPPAGMHLTDDQLEKLRHWILSGADDQ